MEKITVFDFRKKLIYPACTMFFILVFMYFILAITADVNVLESETIRTQIYDDAIGENTLTSTMEAPSALPVQTLLGLFLFSMSVMGLGLLFRLNMSRIYLNLLHFGGTVLAFFVFVLAMSGYISDGGLPMAMISCLAVSVLYFVVRGISIPVKKLLGRTAHRKRFDRINHYLGAVFAGFTVIVFAVSLFALISQLNVIVTVKEDKTFIEDDVLENIFVTVVTPLAPTLQNYLRYLASSAVFLLAYYVLFTKLNKVFKVILNFAILSAGYLGIWIIGFDYFRLVSSNALPAIVIYLALYLVLLVAVCIYMNVKKRNTEANEEYMRQFK